LFLAFKKSITKSEMNLYFGLILVLSDCKKKKQQKSASISFFLISHGGVTDSNKDYK